MTDYRLVPASLEAPAGLAEMLHELGEGENGFMGEARFVNGELSLGEFLQTLVDASEGKGLPEGWVPATTCWLLDERGYVTGMSRLRHRLTPTLLEHGGNIGYYIRRSHRGRGLGTLILRETLAVARGLGLERVLIGANADNEPSLRVIEANGGVFDDERVDDHGQAYRRYWVELRRNP